MASLNHLLQSKDLTNTLASLHRTLEEYRVLSEKVRGKLDPLGNSAEGTLKEAQAALAELRQSLQGVRDLLSPQSSLRQDVAGALDELTEAARSMSALADYLNRNPNALLSGRKHPEPKR
jgi:paraquat-inducible protein B